MKKLLETLFNHERYQSISIIVCSLLLLYFYGCEPKCKSIITPDENVTRSELDLEIEQVIAKANIGYASLEQQEELRDLLFEQALTAASSGTINPIAILTSAAAILGVGATADNIRKRKEIKRLST